MVSVRQRATSFMRTAPLQPVLRSVMLAIVNGRTSVSETFEMGANFVVGKPIQDGRICAVLDMAVPKMEREHRRYFRHRSICPLSSSCTQGSPSGRRCGISAREALPSALAKHCLRVW